MKKEGTKKERILLLIEEMETIIKTALRDAEREP
jgi:hypothetical protein